MKAPDFWRSGAGGLASALLSPVGWALYAGGRARYATMRPANAPVPVLCIGNVVAGGAGKTPVALDIGARLQAAKMNPHFLSRGYGGVQAGPHRVDLDDDRATDVGDEPLLLARQAPTWVARDRAAGAQAMAQAGAGAIIMDDGLQNPSLAKDLSLLVIDGAYGLGNGRLVPAGPLREPLECALAKAGAVVVMGEDRAGIGEMVRRHDDRTPVLSAQVQPQPGKLDLAGREVHAFAGIGHPEKFFQTLIELGCKRVESTAFADHHPFTDDELAALVADAEADGALLLCTEKDYVRLDGRWRDAVEPLPISLTWKDEAQLMDLLHPFMELAN